MTHRPQAQDLRDAMYGEVNLGSFSLFSGDFINYGYWRGLGDGAEISVDERTKSQAELYRQVVSRLDVAADDRLLEIGCGIGAGAALVLREFAPAEVRGLDLSAEQLRRAERANAELLRQRSGRLSFHRGSATELPWTGASFDGVYSVEALQHVDDLAAMAREAHRVLRGGGRLAAATFFAPGEVVDAGLAELLETVDNGVDVVRPVGEFAAALTGAGFGDVTVTAIGEHVWDGLDRWIAQTEYRDTWGRNWIDGYRRGWVDYYVLTARKR
ncbi:MAG: class I SAM-dependent methyltransferase [Stackebrandtia sp.]